MTQHLPTSPAARAFFQALDGESSSCSSSSFNTTSSLIRKKIQVLGWRNRHSQAEFYPVTVGGSTFRVRQVQRGEIDNTYGTGATVWPASIVLVKYLERQSQILRGKHVIDLGSGTGVTSIAAALLSARSVVCTDGEESVVRLARDNVRGVASDLSARATGDTSTDVSTPATASVDDSTLYLGRCPVTVQFYWWGSDTALPGPPADVILASDCVLPKLYPIASLVTALNALLTQPDSVAILSFEKRWYPDYDPKAKFEELASEKEMSVEVVPMGEQDEVYSVDDIQLWRVQRRRCETQPNL